MDEICNIIENLKKMNSIFNEIDINCSKTYDELLKENGFINNLQSLINISKEIGKCEKEFNVINSFIEKIKNIKYNDLFDIFLMFGNKNLFLNNYGYLKISFNEMLKNYDIFISFYHEDNSMHELLNNLLNDENFQNLYCEIMQSKIIKKFVSVKKETDDNLEDNYNNFIEELKNDKKKFFSYIKLETLSLYKKAFVDRFLRIYINDNYIYKSDNLNIEEINEILKAYLIEVLIHDSFHFLRRFKKNGILCEKVISPIMKDKDEHEIGKELIHYIFNVTFIKKLDYNLAKIINNIDNWNIDTNFKNLHIKEDENSENGNKQNCLRFMDMKPKKKNRKNHKL